MLWETGQLSPQSWTWAPGKRWLAGQPAELRAQDQPVSAQYSLESSYGATCSLKALLCDVAACHTSIFSPLRLRGPSCTNTSELSTQRVRIRLHPVSGPPYTVLGVDTTAYEGLPWSCTQSPAPASWAHTHSSPCWFPLAQASLSSEGLRRAKSKPN